MSDQEELAAVASLNMHYQESPHVIFVEDDEVARTKQRVSLSSYLASIFHFKDFTFEHSRHKALADNDEMFLGKLWTLLEPVLRIAMYAVVFGLILNTSKGIDNFLGYLVIGVTFFSMLSKGLSGGSGLLQRNRAMMRTFKFPTASLVFGAAIQNFLSGLIPATLAVITAVAFQWGEPLYWTIVMVVPLYFLLHIFAAGLMFITARVTEFLPDAKKIVFFINRAWFFVSGVFFSVERYATIPELEAIMLANPAYRFLQAIRNAVMQGVMPNIGEFLILMAWSLGAVFFGFWFFWLAERRYIRVR